MTIDTGIFLTMTGSLFVAIICGIVTYGIAIRQAKREIDDAFHKHIQEMHTVHREFVDRVEERMKGED